eukprot:4149684-Amphidinium_carterae.2
MLLISGLPVSGLTDWCKPCFGRKAGATKCITPCVRLRLPCSQSCVVECSRKCCVTDPDLVPVLSRILVGVFVGCFVGSW